MTLKTLVAAMRQPSTVLGVSTLIGTLTALLTDQITWEGALPAIAGGIAAIALPDNGTAQVAIKDATMAVIAAEQAIAHPPAKETIAVGVVRTTMLMALLTTAGLEVSAFATKLPLWAYTDLIECGLADAVTARHIEAEAGAHAALAACMTARTAG